MLVAEEGNRTYGGEHLESVIHESVRENIRPAIKQLAFGKHVYREGWGEVRYKT